MARVLVGVKRVIDYAVKVSKMTNLLNTVLNNIFIYDREVSKIKPLLRSELNQIKRE